MLCPHCNAQWQLPGDNKIQITSCPFCNEDLHTKLKEPYSTGTALIEIFSRFGTDILSDSDDLISAFSVLAPSLEKEKQGLLFFKACGGFDSFLNLQGARQEKVIEIYNNQIKQMTDVITEVCSGILAATGISTVSSDSDMDGTIASTVTWEYANLGNNTIEITACKNQIPTNITFPSEIDGKKVVSIGSAVFGAAKTKGADRQFIENVFIPQGVTTIGSSVFDGCKALKEVSLPNSLLFIGDNAFKNCKMLTNIIIPDNVNFIGKGAFSGSNIQSIVIPGHVENVPEEAFKNCKKLISVTVLDGVTSIQQGAFSGCKLLASVNLPRSMVSIDRAAFYCCESLSNIELPDSISVIGYETFERSSLANLKLPKNISIIENSSFEGCNFVELTIPEGVTQIRDYAFGDCWSLRKITIPQSVTKIESNVFFNIDSEIVIVCYKDSYVHKWALRHKIDVELL